MRCLNCHHDGVPVNAVTCPECGVHLPSAHRDLLPPGTNLHGGKYVIEYALGQGGFGITYRAIQVALSRRVAVKEFFPRDQVGRNTGEGQTLIVGSSQQERFQRSLQRFQQEALTLAALRHPNVVSVLDIFDERKTAYIVMEYLSGKTLRDEIDAAPGRRLSEERVRQVMGVLVDALKTVHAKTVYHLDIKPDNVMVEADGRIVLIDFGAARQGLTGRTTQAFSPEYAPLEARAGGDNGSQVGPGSDIFELGMMLHEMLTGTLPPDAVQRAVDKTRGVEWSPMGVSEPWKTLLNAALKIDLQERPSNVAEWWNMPVKEAAPIVFTDPPVVGEEVRVSVTVSEGVVLVGGHVPVTPPHRDKMAIYVPPGVRDGQELRITGQGKPGKNGGKAGDLLITVRVSAATAKTAMTPTTVGRGGLQTVTGLPSLSEGFATKDPPPSANPTTRPVVPEATEYRIPIWKPVIITLLCILLPLGAAGYYYAPAWVPKYAPGLVSFFPNLKTSGKTDKKPPKKPVNKKPGSGKRTNGGGTASETVEEPRLGGNVRQSVTAADLDGTWVGTLGSDKNAELHLTQVSAQKFSGEVSSSGNAVQITGTVTGNGTIYLKEVGVIAGDAPIAEPDPTTSEEPPPDDGSGGTTPPPEKKPTEGETSTVWHFGSATGRLSGDGRHITGNGASRKDRYRFFFNKS